jgi:hypothetical protein
VQIQDDLAPLVVRALEHYAAFMRATNRDERPYLDIAESLKKKGQAKEEQERPGKRKRA